MAGLEPNNVMAVGVEAAQATDLLEGNVEEDGAGGGEDGRHAGRAGELEDSFVESKVWLLGDGDVVYLLCREKGMCT